MGSQYVGHPWDIIAGDDWVLTLYPDDDTEAGSTTAMQAWSEPIVSVRDGTTTAADLLLTSQGASPTIGLNGHTFPGAGGLVVPATDFTVPVMSVVILAEAIVPLLPAGKRMRHLFFEVEVKVEGVRTTVIPSTPWRVWSQTAVRA